MEQRVFAILVHDKPFPIESLRQALRDLHVDTYSVHSCKEARDLISQTHPQLVFTDVSVSDGSWADVVSLAEHAEAPLDVIVVGSTVNTKFYVSAIERGAFDFVLPPFELGGLRHVVRTAELNVRDRRMAQTQPAKVD